MKVSKEVKIGLIVVSGIAILFWGINYLKGRDFFTSQKLVYVVYNRVDGLSNSNPVLVNGLKVGAINSLSLMPDNSGRIVVAMHLENAFPIPRNSVAEIFNRDVLGTKAIRLVLGDSNEEVQRGDTLVAAIQKNIAEEFSENVVPIREKAENLMASLDSVLTVFRNVFNEKTKENLRKSFESIATSLESIEGITAAIDTSFSNDNRLEMIFKNLESIASNISRNNAQITNIINNFSEISDSLTKANIVATIESMRKTLDQTNTMFTRINSGEGTLGQLATNDSLYSSLNSTSQSLDSLLRDFKANPKRYVHFSVFGKKNQSAN
jgi:phospholipid/cholesterol/gamma-HCH transport system substrate-binding protein